MSEIRFDPGQIVATRGAVDAYLLRHVAGDWGR